MKSSRTFLRVFGAAAFICFFSVVENHSLAAQSAAQKPAEKSADKSQDKPAIKAAQKLPAEIELLETHIRFETNGDSRKEIHARVKINDELGARQFARLNFDFNRSFEKIEIPLVRVTHPSGGTADVLPSAITDNPNPAVVNAPAYQDVRVKSVRILGLEPGDSLEYRVITTVSHHPLAPDFWLDHTFDRSGVATHQNFELDLPLSLFPETTRQQSIAAATDHNDFSPEQDTSHLRVSPGIPSATKTRTGEGDSERVVYRWELTPSSLARKEEASGEQPKETDIVVTTLHSWKELAMQLGARLMPGAAGAGPIIQKELELSRSGDPTTSIYDFVSKKITTVDLPLGSTGFQMRRPEEILSSGYATAEDKVALFSAIYRYVYKPFLPVFICSGNDPERQLPRPSLLSDVLIEIQKSKSKLYLQPSLEVAPFGVIRADLRGKRALLGYQAPVPDGKEWTRIISELPFPSTQHVSVDAHFAMDGSLGSKVKYEMRGDNELLLRVAFHTTPKENWKNVAQLLALSDGFRGKITNVTGSDPYDTHNPFNVEYEITQPKFIDWSKKPLRVPAILPLLGLPDPPTKPAPGAAATPIDLGTPLDVEVSATIHLPAGITAHIPTGTSLQRDFATYTSQYSAKDGTLTATRHLNFILKEIPADRAGDYIAFLRTVQNDESQVFTLERQDPSPTTPSKP